VRKIPRLAVIFDAVEERWPSMDYVAEMLVKHLQEEHADKFETVAVKPRFFGAFERLPGLERRKAWNADRFVTRFLTYPLEMVLKRGHFDLFHVADHTYAQLVHVLPADRTGVFCHDLDAFEPVLGQSKSVPIWRREMARVQLRGLRRAAVVFHSTSRVREQAVAGGLLEDATLVRAPYGVSDEFFALDGVKELPPGCLPERPFLLHVGSGLPRKRLDVLFRVFAEIRKKHPALVLVQQGAELLPDQSKLVADLGISNALFQPPRLSRPTLAALYHRAELVLVTSESEGFGLPILEALAAGTTLVVSDIPAFREVAGDAVTYCPVGDVNGWVETVSALLDRPDLRPAAPMRKEAAARFTWTAHASIIANVYARLAGLDSARA
jgi:glycosyltransferase involved in cell wall biosynthesis